jgi:hypothetical protein
MSTTNEVATSNSNNAASTQKVTAYRKEIFYDRDTRDYACYLDGELIGFQRNYHEAEIYLDSVAFDLLSGGAFRDAA